MNTAAVFALVLSMVGRPVTDRDELYRFATIAVAVETAASEQVVKKRWGSSYEMLVRALITVIDFESGKGSWKVHTGNIRDNGAYCLAQIRKSNGYWKRLGYTHPRQLVGLGLKQTTDCMRAAAMTLSHGLVYARRNGYQKHRWQAMWTVYAGIPRSCRYSKKHKMWFCKKGRHFSRQASTRTKRMWKYKKRRISDAEWVALREVYAAEQIKSTPLKGRSNGERRIEVR